MENYSLQVLLTQGLTILVLFLLILYLLRQRRIIRLEKRFQNFALISTFDEEKSIFDIIMAFFWRLIHRVSSILEKSVFLKKYGMRYDKFIKFEQKDEISGMDLIAFLFLICNLLTAMFQVVNVSFMSLLITFFLGFFLPDLFLQLEYQKKRKKVEEDLLKAIIVMNNSFKSGRNIMQAVEIVKNELIDIKNRYNDERRSEIIMGDFNIDDEDLITKEDIIVFIIV